MREQMAGDIHLLFFPVDDLGEGDFSFVHCRTE